MPEIGIPSSKQPWTYKLQSWLWVIAFDAQYDCIGLRGLEQSNNKYQIFFTATYSQNEIVRWVTNENSSFQFIFVGALVKGKKSVVCH
jgi:hypothetical protein